MRIALFLQEDWDTAPRVVSLFQDAGHEPVVNPDWDALDGLDAGMVRANYWEPGLRTTLAKAMVVGSRGVPFLNSIASVRCCADKAVSGALMRSAGLDVPFTWLLRAGDLLPLRDHQWVVKPRVGAHQCGVEVFPDRGSAQRHLDSCSSDVVVQERIVGTYWRVIATPRRAVRTYSMPVDARGVTALPDGAERRVVDDPDPRLESVAVAMVRALGGTALGLDLIEDAGGRYWAIEGNAGFGFNVGDAEVEQTLVTEAERLAAGAARPVPA
jgi:glutathione synthase/RimK-type ligase-like ATP-grasp enzyme